MTFSVLNLSKNLESRYKLLPYVRMILNLKQALRDLWKTRKHSPTCLSNPSGSIDESESFIQVSKDRTQSDALVHKSLNFDKKC